MAYNDDRTSGHAPLVGALAAGLPLSVPLRDVRPDIDVISGGERLDDLAGLLLSRHRNGAAVADVLAEPLSMMLETGDYDLVIIDSPPGGANLQLADSSERRNTGRLERVC